MQSETVYKILEKHRAEGDGLISVLDEIQGRYGFLPADALKIVAQEMNRPLVEVYGVATFYRAFSLQPRGRHLVSCCLGTACHVRGAPNIAEEMQNQLGVKYGQTTPDNEFTLETVNCLGACALGPVVVVDGHYFSNVKKKTVKEILTRTREGLDKIELSSDQRVFPLEVHCPRCNHSLMDPKHLIDGYPAVRVTITCEGQHGWMTLSSLYGSYNVASEFVIPPDCIAQFFCPYCHSELIGISNCPLCNTVMVPLIIRGGGMVQLCPRRGCKGHLLDVSE
jgi:NADH-quinone oxidoreductase subunit E